MPVTIGNLRATWANSEITYTGIGMNVNATSYDANSSLLDLKLNSNTVLKVASNGVLYVNGVSIVATIDAGLTLVNANVSNTLANTSGVSFNGNLNFPTGNVGIGLSNPTSNLHVVGTANITGNLYVVGTANITGNLHVVGTANITNTLTVAGSNVFAVNVQTFTTSGTWYKPTGFGANSRVFIQAWGGGGSGGRGGANTGAGGGGGGYNFTWEKLSDLGATETVTIGLGGASRTTATYYQPGAAGGTSSFGTLLYAYGGGGGSNSRPSTGYTFGGSGGGQTSAGGTATTFNDSSGNPGGPLIVRSATYSGAAPTLVLFYQGHGRTLQDSDVTAYVGPFEAYMHGGGGGGGGGTGQPSTRQGGTSVWGGGGGGANNSNGGISIYGGNGGNGKSTSAEATAGIEPGGGGGGSNTASGAGANGRIIVTVFAG